jgi:hypothetical protein
MPHADGLPGKASHRTTSTACNSNSNLSSSPLLASSVDFRSRKQKRSAARQSGTVSSPSAGYGQTFGYTGTTLHTVDFWLSSKPELPKLTTSSPILDFALGEISYDECFVDGSGEMLAVKEEEPESTRGGIKAAPKKERNLNSVSCCLSLPGTCH